MTETSGFIGLGHLGLPVAANLLDASHALGVYNRTASKADALVSRGAERANWAVDVMTTGGIVVSLLWDDASVENMVSSDGFLERLGRGGGDGQARRQFPADIGGGVADRGPRAR